MLRHHVVSNISSWSTIVWGFFQYTLLKANDVTDIEPNKKAKVNIEKAKQNLGISYEVEGELGRREYHVDLYPVDENATKVTVGLDKTAENVTVKQGDFFLNYTPVFIRNF